MVSVYATQVNKLKIHIRINENITDLQAQPFLSSSLSAD
jgi:hypothetical protein